MVELRKRPAPPPAPPPAKKKAAPKSKAKKNEPVAEEPAATEGAADDAAAETAAKDAIAEPAEKSSSSSGSPPKQGDKIELDSFGGEIDTNDGQKVTLAQLVQSSKKGVVLFTYPKASTPGCTTQVCLFRDSYAPLTATGLAIYGLSTDSPKANTTFKTKQNLPYPLLCDPSASLIKAIGFKKVPKGTQRGVFVVDKEGKVLAVEAGGPAATVEVVKGIVGAEGGDEKDEGLEKAEETAVEGGEKAEETAVEGGEKEAENHKIAETAAEVADVAKGLDGTPLVGTPAA
ncbi:hypothetical protein Q7P37_009147 [Cladosporium fusiforme]